MHSDELKIVHGDIKPDNILIDKKTLKATICDFGLSKISLLTKSMSQATSSVVGTHAYMAPELLLHQGKNTIFSDIWAMACTIIEIYTYQYVYDGSKKAIIKLQSSSHAMRFFDSVPGNIRPFLKSCLSINPKERPMIKELCKMYDPRSKSFTSL